MPKLSELVRRPSRRPTAEQQARIQSEAEGVADVTGPKEPPGLAEYDESVAGVREAADPEPDLEET